MLRYSTTRRGCPADNDKQRTRQQDLSLLLLQPTKIRTRLIEEGSAVVFAQRLRDVFLGVVVARKLVLGGGGSMDVRRAALARSGGGRADAEDPAARVSRARGLPPRRPEVDCHRALDYGAVREGAERRHCVGCNRRGRRGRKEDVGVAEV
jgi:hypothetical protein